MDCRNRDVFGHSIRARRVLGEDLLGISDEGVRAVANSSGLGHRNGLGSYSRDHPSVHLG